MKILILILFLLFVANDSIAQDCYECSYYQTGTQELMTEKNCITYERNVRNKVSGGDAVVTKKVIASATYDEKGIGYLYSPVGIFYFTKAGLARKTLQYDNGPDYFRDGLARTEWNGKIAFFDEKLSIVIEPRYDFAFPFENGLSIVCIGCTQENHGEHMTMVGGKWGTINRKGEIVHPIGYSKPELENLLKRLPKK